MELIVPEGISAGDTFLVYTEEDAAEEATQEELEAEAIRLEVEAGIAAAGEKEEQTSYDEQDAEDTSAHRLGGDKCDSDRQQTVESRHDAEQQVSSDEAAARARVAQTEAVVAAAEEAALRAEADEAAASASKAARDERVALERVAALEAELQAAAEAEMSPGRLNPVHVDGEGSAYVGREQPEEEEEEALSSQDNSSTHDAGSNVGARGVLAQSGLGLDTEPGLAETGSPAGWGSPRRQVITHEDEWEAVVSLNGHTYTADKRSGCVFHVPPEDEYGDAGAERVEVGRWDPVQTLIVFNDAAAERERLRGLASAHIVHGSDSHSDVAAATSDVSPRSIAAAVRRKQKQKEHSKEQQAVAASATDLGGESEQKPGAVSSRHATDNSSSGSTSQQTGRVASWAGPPQLILTEDEHDIIVEVLEEVYLVDLVSLCSAPSLCLLSQR
jgi:hypothetical protein